MTRKKRTGLIVAFYVFAVLLCTGLDALAHKGGPYWQCVVGLSIFYTALAWNHLRKEP